MSRFPLIDIHTHTPARRGERVIQNIYKDFHQAPDAFYSAGLHPWFIQNETWEKELKMVAGLIGDGHMLALGECGLDRVCATDHNFQKKVFAAQIILANEYDLPLIIHCVRAHDDVLEMLRSYDNKMPVIFHGFNRGSRIAARILAKGYYLSFGKALQTKTLQQVFSTVPADLFFLETDGADVTLETIYDYAASSRHLTVEEVSLQIRLNFQKVFKTAL